MELKKYFINTFLLYYNILNLLLRDFRLNKKMVIITNFIKPGLVNGRKNSLINKCNIINKKLF